MVVRSKIVNQLLSAIQDGNIKQFSIALAIALAQQPSVDLNQIQQSGHTVLTFAALHYNPSIITKLVREPSVNVNQVNAFNQSSFQIANQLDIPVAALEYLFKVTGRLEQLSVKQASPETAIRLHKCELCEKTCKSLSDLRSHNFVHGIMHESHTCDICERSFPSKQRLERHTFSHTGERPFKCTECDKAFTQLAHLVRHKRIHAGARPFQCRHCHTTFSTSTSRTAHENFRHVRDQPFKCKQCDKTFPMKWDLTRHERVHTAPRCNLCNLLFARVIDLIQHNGQVHQVGETLNVETAVHQEQAVSQQHMHSNDRRYKCDKCGKTFKQKYEVKSHNRIYTEERPFKCDQCDKTFSHSQNLTRHKRIHGPRCNLCNMLFARVIDLRRHNCRVHQVEETIDETTSPRRKNAIRTHVVRQEILTAAVHGLDTDERPFKCDICSQTFQHQNVLHQHRQVHTANRPHKCDKCNYSSKRKEDLVNHKLRFHSTDRPYKCNQCDYATTQNKLLNGHRRRIHAKL